MTRSNNICIDIKGLTKQYAGTAKPSLNNITLHVNYGEVYGFLGPNGAGKSTAIRTLLNFIQPTKGTATINGLNVVDDSVKIKKSLGYLSGDFAIYPKMTGKQYLEYMSEILPPFSAKYMKELLTRFKAEPNKKMGDLSRGNRQKIGIVQAFMHKPDVIILDEPTSGLDPLMQEEFYKLINESKDRGAAVFMSSHIMAEVQRTCDRIGIIRDGKLVDEMVVDELEEKAAQSFKIVFDEKPPMNKLKQIAGLKITSQEGNSVLINLNGKLNPLFKLLSNHKVKSIDTQNLDLEQMFLGFYSGDKK